MKPRHAFLHLLLVASTSAAWAAEGLTPPAVERLWPQWHARVELQTATLSPLAESRWLGLGTDLPQRGLKGGAVLGDYYFANPSFGRFRASGGLMVGSQGGAFSSATAGSSRLGLSVSNLNGPASEAPGTVPYLGLGFTGAPTLGGFAITADVGLIAAGSVSRALLGNQGMEGALRELRLSPVMQLGVSYRF